MKNKFSYLKLISIFLIGLFIGNTFYQYQNKPEIKREILPINATQNIILEQQGDKRTISMDYEIFQEIINNKSFAKDTNKKIASLFYRMDGDIDIYYQDIKSKPKLKQQKIDNMENSNFKPKCNWNHCSVRST